MNIIHSSGQRSEFRSSFPTLLKLALQSTKNDVERKARLAWWAQATHSTQARLELTATTTGKRRKVLGSSSMTTGPGLTHPRPLGSSGGVLQELLLLQLLLLVLLCASGNLRILLGKNADNAGRDLVMNNGLVILPHIINTEFLGSMRECRTIKNSTRTTMSSLLSSNGSDSVLSLLSRSPLMKVPLELLTSLMYICSRGQKVGLTGTGVKIPCRSPPILPHAAC